MLPTKEYLQTALRKSYDDDDLVVTNVKSSAAQDVEMHIASATYTFEASVESKKTPSTIHFFAKSQEDFPGLGRPSVVSNEQFHKEFSFFEILLPDMIKFCEEEASKPIDFRRLVPRYLYSSRDGTGKLTIVFENIAVKGYASMLGFGSGPKHEFKHAKMAVEASATLNAITYAMERKSGVKLTKQYDFLEECLRYEQPFEEALANTMSIAGNFLEDENKPSMAANVHKLKPHIWKAFLDCLKERGKFTTVCHGDFHGGNMMFHTLENPTDLILVDWQAIRYCSVATELMFYLSNLREEEDRAECIRVYHNKFQNTLSAFGIENDSFTYKELLQEIEELKIWQFCYHVLHIAFSPAFPNGGLFQEFIAAAGNPFVFVNKNWERFSVSKMAPPEMNVRELYDIIVQYEDFIAKYTANLD